MRPGRVQRADPVETEVFRGLRVGLQIEGEHEQIGVPEIAALIAPVGQAARADAGAAVGRRHRLDKLKNVVADRTLPFVVTLQLNIRVLPDFLPCCRTLP